MKTYYNHLGLCGLYAVVKPKTGEVINVRLHQSDIILFERVYSLYQCGKDCYMTNEEFTKLGCSERTASACIGRLKKIGLLKVHTKRTHDGRIRDKRYLYVQADRLEQMIEARIEAESKEEPFNCIYLPPLEAAKQEHERREAPKENIAM